MRYSPLPSHSLMLRTPRSEAGHQPGSGASHSRQHAAAEHGRRGIVLPDGPLDPLHPVRRRRGVVVDEGDVVARGRARAGVARQAEARPLQAEQAGVRHGGDQPPQLGRRLGPRGAVHHQDVEAARAHGLGPQAVEAEPGVAGAVARAQADRHRRPAAARRRHAGDVQGAWAGRGGAGWSWFIRPRASSPRPGPARAHGAPRARRYRPGRRTRVAARRPAHRHLPGRATSGSNARSRAGCAGLAASVKRLRPRFLAFFRIARDMAAPAPPSGPARGGLRTALPRADTRLAARLLTDRRAPSQLETRPDDPCAPGRPGGRDRVGRLNRRLRGRRHVARRRAAAPARESAGRRIRAGRDPPRARDAGQRGADVMSAMRPRDVA